jgi:acyl carrier protein
MVPSVFVFLEKLPLASNGKVDRKRLPIPGSERPELGTNHVAPSSSIERIIAGIWAESLGLEKVGVHDNFFDLGGHSLLMAQIQTKLRDALKIDVSIVEMFQYPTVSSLAKHIGAPSDRSSLLQEAKKRARRQRYAFSQHP